MIVYRITNRTNGKVYIGKTTKTLAQRWRGHKDAAKSGQFYFARAIRKYGSKAFKREVVYRATTANELSKMETFFIVLHQSHKPENGYNMTLGGEGASLITDETRGRMSEVRRGMKFAPDHCKHIGDSKRGVNSPHWGRPRSAETRRKIGEAQRGKKLSTDHREKLSKAHQGKTLSKEHRQKLSEAHKGMEFSEEHRKNLSRAASGEKNAGYGTKWVRRGAETVRVPARLLDAYIGQGWQPGRVL